PGFRLRPNPLAVGENARFGRVVGHVHADAAQMAMRLLLNARGDTRLDDPDEGVLEEQLVVLGDHLEHVIVPGLGKCRKSKHRENDHDTAGYRPPANPSGGIVTLTKNRLTSPQE